MFGSPKAKMTFIHNILIPNVKNLICESVSVFTVI